MLNRPSLKNIQEQNRPSKGGSTATAPASGGGGANRPSQSGGTSNRPSQGQTGSSNRPSQQQTAQPAPAQQRPPAQHRNPAPRKGTTTPQTGRDQYGFPLKFGDKGNAYVKEMQKHLLPQNLWTGNYLDKTKAAVAKYISEHQHEFVDYVHTPGQQIGFSAGGEYVPVWLYNMIVRQHQHQAHDANYDPNKAAWDYNSNQPANGQNAAATTQQADPAKTQTTYTGSVVIRFPIHIGFGKTQEEKDLVYDLQNAVNATMTGVLDQETIANVRAYATDAENIKSWGINQPDSKDLNLLNNPAQPGITQRLFDHIIDLANQQDKEVVNETLKRLLRAIK